MKMSLEKYKEFLERSLNEFEMEFLEDTIAGIPTTIIKSDKLMNKIMPRLSLMPAPKMQFNVYIGEVNRVTKKGIEQYAKECYDYGKRNRKELFTKKKGGYGCIAIQASTEYDDDALDFVLQKGKVKYGGAQVRGILDLKDMRLYYLEKSPFVGLLLFKQLRKFANTFLSLET